MPDATDTKTVHRLLPVSFYDREGDLVYHVYFWCRERPKPFDVLTTVVADVTCTRCLAAPETPMAHETTTRDFLA